MPWSSQGGGGWKGGGPWGQPPQGSGPTPPDLEELLRRGQDRLRRVLPGGGGGGNLSARGIALIAVVGAVVWLLFGFYRVEPDEVGVELVLGRVTELTQPGLNYNFPYPIGRVYTPSVLNVREVNIGQQDFSAGRGTVRTRTNPDESLMLTGDENIVDINYKVQWQIKDARNYLFNLEDPDGTVKAVAESAMREIIGQNNIQPILTEQRAHIEIAVQELMQAMLDSYGSGIVVTRVQMQKVDPPEQVIDAFRDVQAARADQERLQNEAQAYANRVVPEARGEAARITQAAIAYRDRLIAEAGGQAQRFLEVYEQYAKAPAVTRRRMFLETMDRVLSRADKIIVDPEVGQGVVPYLPLDRLNPQRGGAGRPQSPSQRPSQSQSQPQSQSQSQSLLQSQLPSAGASQ